MTTTDQAPHALPVSSAAQAEAAEEASRWSMLRYVPFRLSVDIPLPPMSLRALGALKPGQLLCSDVATAEDLAIVIGGAPVCLARFEYTDGRMSIRITRLLGAPGNTPGVAAFAATTPAAAPGAIA